MSTQEKLAAELSIVYPEIVTRIEDKISKVIEIMGASSFELLFKDISVSQRTQTCTKFFQYFATRSIEEICEENEIFLVKVKIYESGQALRANLYFTGKTELVLRNYRASDAIALAVFYKIPILVRKNLLQETMKV